MYHLQKNTLAYLKGRPLFRMVESRNARLPAVVESLNLYMKSAHKASVEESALLFYMGNHFFSLLCQKFDQDEPLPDHVLEQARWYVDMAMNVSRRCYYYTLLIITRESRHLQHTTMFEKTLKAKYGQEYVDFLSNLKGSSDHAVNWLRNNPLDCTMGMYSGATVKVFMEGKFGSSFGGKPWGNIADNLRKVVDGEISLETFTDTAWTLAHNNGPMFNKDMLFEHYTPDLIKILDVQRSGQIPQLVAESRSATKKAVAGMTPEVIGRWRYLHEVVGDVFDGMVDWGKVQAAGAVGTYSHEVKVQKKATGKEVVWITETDYATVVKSKRKAA